ncbi:MIP/aquaporin family protein [Slackia heliotrinireducens]|uniref:MIP/aquaporin family protein n=1 Tax=Slackia heliotrinireducens TaxID=84110 RepID=UPI0033150FD0
MRKYVSECIGTFVLVFLGCGTAMLVGTSPDGGYLLTALAFGLAIVAMAYSIGNVSGCHVNPAVSLAVFVRGDMSGKDLAGYIIAQVIGAFLGACLLWLLFLIGGVTDMTGGLGANGLAGVGGQASVGLAVEIVLTFVFVMAVLGATSSKYDHKPVAGLVIGLSLVLVHILGIGLTGTSVNPARSLGPAVMAFITGNAEPLSSVWVFIVAPLIGGLCAALLYDAIEGRKHEE